MTLDPPVAPDAALSIAMVERETGLSKETLRVWERRYGFPAPLRDAAGDRLFSAAELARLQLIKRLLDNGHRPGRIVPMSVDALQALTLGSADSERARQAGVAPEVQQLLQQLQANDLRALGDGFRRLLWRLGLGRFVTDVVAPFNIVIGDEWLRGRLEVFQEHAASEVLQRVLRQAIGAVPEALQRRGPRVLLATFPDEPHAIGLLMAEALLTLDGCECVSLGAQAPLWEIARAAATYGSDVVALSFTGCVHPNQVFDGLVGLRRLLPTTVPLWVGGSAPVLQRRRVDGVEPFDSLNAIAPALERWREGRLQARANPACTAQDSETLGSLK